MLRLLLLLGSIAISCCTFAQQPAASTDPLRAVHNALFASFIPIEETKNDPTDAALFAPARDSIWNADSQAPWFRHLPPAIHRSPQLRVPRVRCSSAISAPHAPASFASLAPDRSASTYSLPSHYLRSERPPPPRATNARNFYVVTTYTSLQEKLTGVSLNRSAPHGWILQHIPQLPPTRLRFDRPTHTIVSTDTPIDYLIVGSGPAGSVLADQLRRGGKHVLLLASGSFIVPGSMESRLVDDLLDDRVPTTAPLRIHNGMTVGGGSQVNVDLCFAPTLPDIRFRINGWRKDGRIGPDDFTLPQITAAYDWVKSAIGTRTLTASEINPNNHALWDGALRDGLHPKLYDLNTYAPGQSPYPVTDKLSPQKASSLSRPFRTRRIPSMIPDADVRRVLFEQADGQPRAVAVEVRTRAPIPEDGVITDPNHFGLAPNQTVTIRARTIILSAGALGSPTILLRSGVKNDQIGRGIVLHASMPIIGEFDHTIDALQGTQASVYVDDHLIDSGYALESIKFLPAYAALMSPGSAMHTFSMVKAFRNLAGFGAMLIDTPDPNNRLTLDAQGEPIIHYQLSAPDIQRFHHAVSESVRLMSLAGAKQVYLPTTGNDPCPASEHRSSHRPSSPTSGTIRAGRQEPPLHPQPHNHHLRSHAGHQQDGRLTRQQRRRPRLPRLGYNQPLRRRRQHLPHLHRCQPHAEHLHLRKNLRRQNDGTASLSYSSVSTSAIKPRGAINADIPTLIAAAN